MRTIRVAAAALDLTPLDWRGNSARCSSAIEQARERGAQIVLLPELAVCGYGCEDAFHSGHVERRSFDALLELLPETKGLVVGVGLPILHRGALYDAAALCVDGRLAGIVAKQNLAGDGIHYEPRWFREWPAGERVLVEARGAPTIDGGTRVPLGDLIFDVAGVRIGFEICEDAWVADRPGARLASRAIDVVLNPSASHFAFGKRAVREQLVAESSRALHAAYIYSNLLGNEAGRVIYDGASMVASMGTIQAVAPRFSFGSVQVADAVVDLEAIRRGYRRAVSAPSTVSDEPGSCIEVAGFEWRNAGSPSGPAERPDWERSPDLPFEEFTRAEALALYDYLRKSRGGGYVISLSGGADSSTCACLVAQMVRLGTLELGGDEFADSLAIDPDEPFAPQLLTCAYQATENSSEATRHAAETLATALDARYFHLDVQGLVDGYRSRIEGAIERKLDWERDDLTLQNLQARVRSPSIWAFANLRGAILLATSNRSEAAVGYATMDGDTSGGLSPIAGVDKSFVLAYLDWLEKTGPEGLGPIAALSVSNALQPTAELRPPGSDQRDEDDLMPYAVLDAVEELAIRDRLAPQPVLDALAGRFPEFAREQLIEWVRRFFRLWVRNQWKRERLAPSFHLDDENLDPKTWCRYPILGGDWSEELDGLS